MQHIHATQPVQLLSEQIQTRRKLNRLCAAAVCWQIKHGKADATHLRNRRRHLAKHVLKRIPPASRRNPNKLLHAAVMVLAMWGFAGLTMPDVAQAASPQPVFLHLMLDGFDVGFTATPVFVDIDGDGDLDVFFGASGRGSAAGTVRFYRNIGSDTEPTFVEAAGTNPLAGVSVGRSSSPTFVDIDGDGDLDAFVGAYDGTVKFYRNTGSSTTPAFAADAGNNPLAGVDVGFGATPTFADIDGDDDLDAFVGAYDGTVNFYRNTGTKTVPAFVADTGTNPLAGFDVGYYAVPNFVDIDGDGDLDAFVGEYYGTVKFYRNTGSATAPTLVAAAATNPLAGVAVGYSAAPAFTDIDGDGDLDAFIGEFYGTVRFYRNNGSNTAPTMVAIVAKNPLAGVAVDRDSHPTFADIDGDGDLDLFVGVGGHCCDTGTVKFYRNTGSNTAPVFVAAAGTNPLAGVDVGAQASPTFADIDGDGDLDVYIGESYGKVKFYRNTGSSTAPTFAVPSPLAIVDVGYQAKPTFADIDGDGDLDAFVGELLGTVKFYRNTGSETAPTFVADAGTNPLAGVAVGNFAVPTFADIDDDGDLDVFVGDKGTAGYSTLKFYRNTGSNTAPAFVADAGNNPLAGFAVNGNAAPTFADIDGDGDLDAFVGEINGKVKFFENLAFQSIVLPAAAGTLHIGTLTAGAFTPTSSLTSATLVNPPAGNFPFGQVSFNVTTTAGGTAVVRLVFPAALPAGFVVYTVDNASNYKVVPTANYTQLNSTTLDITLIDGGDFDLDSAANGVIIESIAVSIPGESDTLFADSFEGP